MKISVYIITFNEVEKIRDCINSVLWVDEIILIDSHSDDGTSEIAESLGLIQASNMVAVATYLTYSGLLDVDRLVTLIEASFKKKSLVPKNVEVITKASIVSFFLIYQYIYHLSINIPQPG